LGIGTLVIGALVIGTLVIGALLIGTLVMGALVHHPSLKLRLINWYIGTLVHWYIGHWSLVIGTLVIGHWSSVHWSLVIGTLVMGALVHHPSLKLRLINWYIGTSAHPGAQQLNIPVKAKLLAFALRLSKA
jgi:hypothetical protein